ncbi:MAG: hypothetical protein ABH824_00870 [Nanoarchaeota archaeon]|nr:glutathionylspermidine synthase family protein [Nanoarchaeota archaeon]MBU1632735.1 glutathionylspermidine synthase family protein [Nanoarchaeota archaeon]MBU1876651.1 glutathionylspermidine synthase family protein [Nanoarchaeota archaeon]
MDHSFKQFIQEHDTVLDPLGRRVAKVPLTPFFYSEELVTKINLIAQSYFKLLEHLSKNYETFKDFIGYDSDLEKLLSKCPDYDENIPLARLDIFLTEKEGIKIVEANCETPGGNEESYHLEKIFKKKFPELVGSAHSEDRLSLVLETLIHNYQQQMIKKGLQGEIKEKPRIILLEWENDITRIRGEFDVFLDYARNQGFECDIVPPQRISFGNYAQLDGKPVDLFYRRFLLNSLPKMMKVGYDFAMKINDSKTPIINPFSSNKANSKKTQILFSDQNYEHLFPEELKTDLELVRKYIPITIDISNHSNLFGIKEQLKKEKDSWVIKGSNSYSSVDVFIGIDINPTKWDELVEKTVGNDFIAQRKIELPRINVKMYDSRKNENHQMDLVYNVNPYILDGKFSGFYVRASEDNLTSFKVGLMATVLPCYKK